jgi:hypothetical protein
MDANVDIDVSLVFNPVPGNQPVLLGYQDTSASFACGPITDAVSSVSGTGLASASADLGLLKGLPAARSLGPKTFYSRMALSC